MTTMPTSTAHPRREFYRPSQRAPYLSFDPTSAAADTGDGVVTSRGSAGEPLSATETSPRRRSGSHLNLAMGAGASKTNLLDLVGSPSPARRSQISSSGNTTSEADTAAGGFQQRVSSFSSLMLSATTPSNRGGGAGNISESEPDAAAWRRRSLGSFPTTLDAPTTIIPDWRIRDRMKTVAVGLIVALNVGTDPPDVVKPHPCAVLQCWMDPSSVSRSKAKELIGERLQQQYAKWQLAGANRNNNNKGGTKYRKALDPTVEDVRNLCLRLRQQARGERCLLHYNGHGVPRATHRGELWAFDKAHTEYIPLSAQDLRQWLGQPSIVVLDCNSAAVVIPFLTKSNLLLRNNQNATNSDEASTAGNSVASGVAGGGSAVNSPNNAQQQNPNQPPLTMDEQASLLVKDTVVLCACSENEWLPMHPAYPADVFTSCLTTPIPMALRWFVNRNPASMSGLSPEAVDRIPGVANDRKTPLGELNWIFTAVTDSIAWNVLPKPLFQRLLRQDLLVASMFRNFLLADRILRSLGCTPVSHPPLPHGTATHPLWQAWDLACETLLHQLMRDGILVGVASHTSASVVPVNDIIDDVNHAEDTELPPPPPSSTPESTAAIISSVSSPFFSEMLTAFEAWLEFSEVHKMKLQLGHRLESPEQLPVVLQVLLSPVHRIRALLLLRRFFDLGPWAVNLSLSLGILPYCMKLLQSPEYKSLLISIWAAILSFDPSCRVNILKDGAFHHFVNHLMWGLNHHPPSSSRDVAQDAAKERTLAAYVLAVACHEYPAGQAECVRLNLHGHCAALLSSYEQGVRSGGAAVEWHLPAHFRLWLCLCLGNLVQNNVATQTEAYAVQVHHRLALRLQQDPAPAVRAAVCYALGALIGRRPKKSPSSNHLASSSSLQDMPSAQQPQQQQLMFQQQQQQLSVQPSWMSQQRLTTAPNVVALQAPPVMGNQQHPSLHAATFAGAAGLAHLQPQQQQQPLLIPGQQQLPIHLAGTGVAHHQPQQPMSFWNPQQQQQPGHPGESLTQQLQPQYVLHHPHHHGQGTPGFMVGGSSGPPGLLSPQGPLMASGQLRAGQQQSSFSLMPADGRGSFVAMARPTVYEDRHRLELDLSSLEVLLGSGINDGSVVVRYEATLALGGVVAKYLDAFVVVAEDFSQSMHESSLSIHNLLPRGLENSDLVRFRAAWKALKGLQRGDPFPLIAQAANNIVSLVHENLLSLKMGKNSTESDRSDMVDVTHRPGMALVGINEEPSPLPSGSNSPSVQYGKGDGKQQQQQQQQRGRKLDQADIRRVVSEIVTGGITSMEDKALLNSPLHIPTSRKHSEATNYTLPKSQFFEWKKNAFAPSFQWLDGEDDDDDHALPLDPLSPLGAAKAYKERRNSIVRDQGEKLRQQYASLAPKPPKPKKQSIEQMLEEENETELAKAEEEASAKKRELELYEKCIFRNQSVNMTSLVSFHPYEDYLVACGVNDAFVWNTENGERLSTFNNKNPKGSRITSACWVNEESLSLFLIGCDDGTVKVWGSILDSITGLGTQQPTLVSAFQAAPMEAGHWGSGLVTEWQPFSGTLIAGGNSKLLRCWNLEVEKVVNKMETIGDAYITTLTTAWDYERLGAGQSSQASLGIGPDIVVAGHSDGSLRLFDIRSNAAVNEMRETSTRLSTWRPRQRISSYSEHKSYVVTTAFTGYGGRYELISGTVSGEVKAWDLRMSSSTRTFDIQRSTMTALAIHSKIPIMATGSHAQFIKVATHDGETMQVLRYHERLANHRIGPVSCLAFHPFKPLLAAGATDSYIGLYTTKQKYNKK